MGEKLAVNSGKMDKTTGRIATYPNWQAKHSDYLKTISGFREEVEMSFRALAAKPRLETESCGKRFDEFVSAHMILLNEGGNGREFDLVRLESHLNLAKLMLEHGCNPERQIGKALGLLERYGERTAANAEFRPLEERLRQIGEEQNGLFGQNGKN